MLSAVIGALTAASAIAGTVADYMDARSAYKTAVQQYKDEVQERREDYFIQMVQLGERGMEANTSAAGEALERKLELQRETSRLSVAMGAANITGNTVQRLLVDATQKGGRDLSTIEYNRENAQKQIFAEGFALRRRAKAPKFYGKEPNITTTLLRGAAGVGSGYTAYASRSPLKGSTTATTSTTGAQGGK